MPGLPPIVVAGLTGFISGVLLSIPVGPVNLTVMNEGVHRGFRRAALIGLGASAMESLYCAIAFTGFVSLFDHRAVKICMEVFSFLFMLFLGTKFLLAKHTTATPHLTMAADRVEHRIEEKIHPHSAFMIGFVRTLANPGVLLFWIVLATAFLLHDLVTDKWRTKLACIVGVALGTSLWFAGVGWFASRGHGQYSSRTLRRVELFSGLGLLAYGLFLGARILWQLAHHKL